METSKPNSGDNKIIHDLELTTEERLGVEKFLAAAATVVDTDSILESIISGEDEADHYLPLDGKNNTTPQQEAALLNVMQEFLGAYLLVGYDLSGQRIEYISCPNDITYDALSIRAQKIFPEWLHNEEMMGSDQD